MSVDDRHLTEAVRGLARVRDRDLVGAADTPAARALLAEIVATPRPLRRRSAARGSPAVRRALAAAAVLLAAALGGRLLLPAGAGAAWAAVPSPVAADQEALARTACAADASPLDGRPLPALAVLDLRGARAYASFADEARVVGCLLDTPEGGAWSGEVVQAGERTVLEGALRPDSVMTLDTGGAVSHVAGEVGADVARVVVDIPELGRAEASVARGRFSIWWPGEVFGVTVTALAADGAALATVALDELV